MFRAVLALACLALASAAPTRGPPVCCEALTATCLACSAGVSVAEYCAKNPRTLGCKATPKPTCALIRCKAGYTCVEGQGCVEQPPAECQNARRGDRCTACRGGGRCACQDDQATLGHELTCMAVAEAPNPGEACATGAPDYSNTIQHCGRPFVETRCTCRADTWMCIASMPAPCNTAPGQCANKKAGERCSTCTGTICPMVVEFCQPDGSCSASTVPAKTTTAAPKPRPCPAFSMPMCRGELVCGKPTVLFPGCEVPNCECATKPACPVLDMLVCPGNAAPVCGEPTVVVPGCEPIPSCKCPAEPPATPPTPLCCRAMTAQCLACSAQLSVAEYCAKNPRTLGCKATRPEPTCALTRCKAGYTCVEGQGCVEQPPTPVCCKAMTAQCLACADQVSVAEYCAKNPRTLGCKAATPEPPKPLCADKKATFCNKKLAKPGTKKFGKQCARKNFRTKCVQSCNLCA